MSKIVAVEGICCSGKSTLVGSLGHTDMGVVKEYGAYTKGQFPKLANTQEELIENTRFFIELERKRYKDSLVAVRHHHVLVLDRSFITCCAFDYAAFARTKLSSHQSLIESMWQEEIWKLSPDLMVILEVDEVNFHQRLKKSGKVLNQTLCDPKFNRRVNQYLRNVPTHWGIKVVRINTNHLDLSQVLEQALGIL